MKKNMKVVIANGLNQADYIISIFAGNKRMPIVINSNKEFSQLLSDKHGIDVFVGDPFKPFTLQEAKINDADIFIALDEHDANNFVSCMLAKKLFNVKKCICTVANPKNVEIFEELGIDCVVSSTHLLAESIKSESNVEEVVKTLSLEQGKINILEITIGPNDYVNNKKIMELGMPRVANISCIYRNPSVIIPNGQTTIKAKDKLTIVTEKKDAEMVKRFILTGEVNGEEENR